MASGFVVTLNGPGLLLHGLCENPSTLGAQTYIIDGLGLNTFGFVWNAANVWFNCYTQQNVVWGGCSTCALTCS